MTSFVAVETALISTRISQMTWLMAVTARTNLTSIANMNQEFTKVEKNWESAIEVGRESDGRHPEHSPSQVAENNHVG